MQKITPHLWFDTEAEVAAKFYTSIFKNSKILSTARYGKEGYEIHRREAGSVMTIEFELEGQRFLALNGGPIFKFNESISFMVSCETQEEVDYFWDKLGEGGDPAAQQCGWLKDKYGLSWQIIPSAVGRLMGSSDPVKAGKAMNALLKMKKIDIQALEDATKV